MGRGHGSTRSGGASARSGGGGGFGGFSSADSVSAKAFEDNKFRVGVSQVGSGDLFKMSVTNAPLEGGGTHPIQTFHGNQKEIMKMANDLKAGKTLNYAHEHRYD